MSLFLLSLASPRPHRAQPYRRLARAAPRLPPHPLCFPRVRRTELHLNRRPFTTPPSSNARHQLLPSTHSPLMATESPPSLPFALVPPLLPPLSAIKGTTTPCRTPLLRSPMPQHPNLAAPPSKLAVSRCRYRRSSASPPLLRRNLVANLGKKVRNYPSLFLLLLPPRASKDTPFMATRRRSSPSASVT